MFTVTALVTPANVAVIVAEVLRRVGRVDTTKTPWVAPAASVTVEGADATATFELASAMIAPPVGAGADNVTLPLIARPPVTLVGLSTSVASTAATGGGGSGGFTVNVVVLLAPL